MEMNKPDDTVSTVLSLLQLPAKKKKVSCDPILNTINSNKEKRKMVKAGNKSKAVQKS